MIPTAQVQRISILIPSQKKFVYQKMKFIVLFVCFAAILGAGNTAEEEESLSLFDQINSSPVLRKLLLMKIFILLQNLNF